jgi:ATP/maltotriose-dependent transcriptional regulator MalT
MPAIVIEVTAIVLALLLCSGVLWRFILFKKRANKQSELLTETAKAFADMQKQLLALQEKNKQYKEFQDSLNQAEITTRLQKSRLSVQEQDMPAPERYRYVHSLAASGMSSQEIASVLSISIHEAEQLVNLARLAHLK